MNIRTVAAAALAAAALAVAGCQQSTSSGPATAASSLGSALKTSQAVQHDRQLATANIVRPCQRQLPDLRGFSRCAEERLGIAGGSPEQKAKRGALENCLIDAARADHLTTRAGRARFETAGAPDCAAQILAAAGK